MAATADDNAVGVADLDTASFHRRGSLLVQRFLSGDKLTELRRWVDEIEAWPVDPHAGWFQHDERGERGVVRTRTENFSPFHAGMRTLLTDGAIPAMAGALLGERAVLYKEKINYKHPGGAGFAAHQDAPAYPHLSESVSCLLAVDDATPENGCLELVAGRHHHLLATNADGCVRDDLVAELDWTPEPVSAGGLLWFHSHTPHRSATNRSARSRRALYLTYNAQSLGDLHQSYYADKRAAFAQLGQHSAGGSQRVSLIGHFQGRPPTEEPR